MTIGGTYYISLAQSGGEGGWKKSKFLISVEDRQSLDLKLGYLLFLILIATAFAQSNVFH